MRALTAAIVLVLMGWSPLAWAQRDDPHSIPEIIRGVVAQYQAALIRERHLADDRTLSLIAGAELRMRAARSALTEGRDNRAGTLRALEEERAEYVRLVSAVTLRDATTRVEVEAFRAEIAGQLPVATPELLAAYREFADGDRAHAWTTLQALLRARASARTAAARAAAAGELRQLADLHEIMRVHGEATTSAVLALRDQAAQFEPAHVWNNIYRAQLALFLNNLTASQAAAAAAAEAADNTRDRAVAMDALGNVERARNDGRSALIFYREGLALRRMLLSIEPENSQYARDVWVSLNGLGNVLLSAGGSSSALNYYEEALRIARDLYAADRADAQTARDVMISLNQVGDVRLAQGNLDGASAYFREALALARQRHSTSPTEVESARDLSVSLTKVGEVLQAQGNSSAATAHFRESLQISRSLYAADEGNAVLGRDVSLSLERLASIPGSGTDWRDVANFMETLDRRGLLAPADRPHLIEYQRRAERRSRH